MKFRMLSRRETADKLGVSIDTVRRLIDYGDLKASKIGSQWRISAEEIDRFLSKDWPEEIMESDDDPDTDLNTLKLLLDDLPNRYVDPLARLVRCLALHDRGFRLVNALSLLFTEIGKPTRADVRDVVNKVRKGEL